MPHIRVQCYPKHLTEKQMQDFVSDMTHLIEKHLTTTAEATSIDYEEIAPEQWEEQVVKPLIEPRRGYLAKEPGTCIK